MGGKSAVLHWKQGKKSYPVLLAYNLPGSPLFFTASAICFTAGVSGVWLGNFEGRCHSGREAVAWNGNSLAAVWEKALVPLSVAVGLNLF